MPRSPAACLVSPARLLEAEFCYYLHSPKHRWVAAKFPPAFRKNSIIGRFILDGTKTSDLLLQAERKYTSEQGNCIVFDPGNGLHRGGICTQDNRINLQIALH